jgi:hypothetical protein
MPKQSSPDIVTPLPAYADPNFKYNEKTMSYHRIRDAAATPSPSTDGDWPPQFELMKLEAQAPSGKWVPIFSGQLEWMAQQGHPVRAIEAPDATATLTDRVKALEAALHDAFMAMCAHRDRPDDEVFQDAIDALGLASSGVAQTPTPRNNVTLAPHELEAMRELVAYTRAMSHVLTDKSGDTLAVKLKNYAQMIEDVITRIELDHQCPDTK